MEKNPQIHCLPTLHRCRRHKRLSLSVCPFLPENCHGSRQAIPSTTHCTVGR